MKNVTKEFLSLFYYIKDNVLIEFIEEDTDVTLNLSASDGYYYATSVMEPSPVGNGRGWVYFPVSNSQVNWASEQGVGGAQQMVTIYKAGSIEIPKADYTVHYPIGAIEYTGVDTPVKADYYWNYISVLDAWPSDPIPELPVVSIEMPEFEKIGFQLGRGKKNIRGCSINVFASSSSELKDITETIFDGLYHRCIYPYDFEEGGHPLSYDGSFNANWASTYGTTISGYGVIFAERVKATRIGLPPVALSDVDRYRSRITFDLESIVE